MPEVYVHLRDVEVDSAECLHSCVTVFRDGAGGVVGFEILGAIGVEVDGKPVQLPKALAEGDIEKVVQVLQSCRSTVRDEKDYYRWCAKRVLEALRETP